MVEEGSNDNSHIGVEEKKEESGHEGAGAKHEIFKLGDENMAGILRISRTNLGLGIVFSV